MINTKKTIKIVVSFIILSVSFCNAQNFNMTASQLREIYDDVYYKATYPDIAKAYGTSDAFRHFVDYGMNEWRKPSAVFDPTYYKNHYEDLKYGFGNNAYGYYAHFVLYGRNEMRRGSQEFDPVFYKNNNSDLINAYGNSGNHYYWHYIVYGQKEKRAPVSINDPYYKTWNDIKEIRSKAYQQKSNNSQNRPNNRRSSNQLKSGEKNYKVDHTNGLQTF